jgi:hypothetical protein
MARDIHVVPSGNKWVVKEAGKPTPLSSHRTQGSASEAGKKVAQANESELVIHRPDGTIRDKDSFGNDSCPPRDKKH